MEDVGVHCTISLDGRKDDNDKHRVYYKTTERSVHDDVMERLAPLRKSNLGVSLVFTAHTVDRLLSNVDAFHRIGFGRITFNPELYEVWPEAKIAVMRTVLSGLARWYKVLLDSGTRAPQLQILFAVLESLEHNRAGERWWHSCHNMTLGPDGKYYSCDKALSFPVGAPGLRVGRPRRHGLGRRPPIDGFVDWIEKRAGDQEIFCPSASSLMRASRARSDAALANSGACGGLRRGPVRFVDSCQAHPAFQELYVRARVV